MSARFCSVIRCKSVVSMAFTIVGILLLSSGGLG
jgi:hypothetical protein